MKREYPQLTKTVLTDGIPVYSVRFHGVEYHAIDVDAALRIWQALRDVVDSTIDISVYDREV
jgi:hypothetical protein